MSGIGHIGKKDTYQVDMCHGPLTGKIIRFTIPLIITGILQLCFHTADLAVIGRFASHKALAAVGAAGPLSMLFIALFLGLSVGTNVLVARYLGERNWLEVSRSVHTAILVSLTGGALLGGIGLTTARPILALMNTPDEIMDMAVLYMQITFIGMPLIMLYNFGSAVLRAMGDTTRPFYFLVLGGVINILLNLYFVIVCGMDVAGVAIATVVSQGVAGALIVLVLKKNPGPCRLRWQHLSFHWKNIREMMWIGLPAGFQSSCFTLSNLLIQSSINTFGSAAIAGITASNSLDVIVAIGHTAISQAAISFVSQNYGAGNPDRVKKSIQICIWITFFWSFVISAAILIFSQQLLRIFNSDPEVICHGGKKLCIILPTLFTCSIMEVYIGALRGLGKSVSPTVIMLVTVCLMRVIWIFAVFNPMRYSTKYTADQAFFTLFISYPLTWILCAISIGWLLERELKKLKKTCSLQ